MNRIHLTAYAPLLISAALLTACGGADDDYAGSSTPYSVVPSTLTVKAPTGTPAGECVAAFAGEVFIYGGAAPYRLDNTAVDALVLSTSQVDHREGAKFSVTVTGICVSPGIVTVVDALDRQVTLKVVNSPAS
jgi:hypothetical protein